MSFLNHINPFYWKKVADKCAAITTELVNKNTRLTQDSVNLKQENRKLRRTVEDFTVDVKNQLALKNEELAYEIATGKIDPARAKLLLDIHVLKDEVKYVNERFTNRNEMLKASQKRVRGLLDKVSSLRSEVNKLMSEKEALEAKLKVTAETVSKLRTQNNKYFELIAGVGVDEGVLLTASHRGKKIVHVDMDSEE